MRPVFEEQTCANGEVPTPIITTSPCILLDVNGLQDCGLLNPTDLNFLMEICWLCHIFMDSLPLPLSVNDAQAAQVDAGASNELCADLMPGS